MPHQIIEYSANIEELLNVRELVKSMHATAVGIDALPTGGIRTRAVRRDIYEIADGHPANTFINVTLRIAAGRPLEVQQAAGEALFATLTETVSGVFEEQPMSLSCEIQEIKPDTRWKKSNIRDYMVQRETGNTDV